MKNHNNSRLLCIKVPVFAEDETRIPFIGLALITSSLKENGYNTEQIDLNAISRRLNLHNNWTKSSSQSFWTFESVQEYLLGLQNEYIDRELNKLLSKIDFSQIETFVLSVGLYDNVSSIMALCIGRYIKNRNNHAIIILGGERYPNYEPVFQLLDKLYDIDCIDYYIRSYGEKPLLELLGSIRDGRKAGTIPGVYQKSNGFFQGTPPAAEYKVHFPEYEGLVDSWHNWEVPSEIASKFLNGKVQKFTIIPVKLTHGCPNKCAFCRSSLDDKKHINSVDPKHLEVYIEKTKQIYDTKYFFFSDDIFNISRGFVKGICQALIPKQIIWSDCAQFLGWTEDLLQLTRESGAVKLIYGLESASPRLQRLIGKNVDLEHAEKVLKWSHEAGIFNGLEIIAGLPTERPEDVRLTVEFINRNSEYLDEVTLNSFYLLKGSEMGMFPEKFGIENVRQILSPESDCSDRYHPLHTFDFDEINGLKWSDKQKQILDATNKIRRCLEKNELEEGNRDRLHILFALYDSFADKKEVTKRYISWKKLYQD